MSLWILSGAVVSPFRAGEQTPVTVSPSGREVHVTDGQIEWRGSVKEWREAVTEAATRPVFPGDEWQPGPVEATAKASMPYEGLAEEEGHARGCTSTIPRGIGDCDVP